MREAIGLALGRRLELNPLLQLAVDLQVDLREMDGLLWAALLPEGEPEAPKGSS